MPKGTLIIDRNGIFRHGLSEIILNALPNSFVYEAASMGQAMSTVRRVEDIGLVLLDALLLGEEGGQLIPKIREIVPNVKILVISEMDDFYIVQSALDSGANGFISKLSEPPSLMREIFLYLNNCEFDFISPSSDVVGNCIVSTDKTGNENSKYSSLLTKRQNEIALLIKEGLTNKEISERVYLSEGTVKNYISRIYEEISVSSRAQAIIKLNNYL